MKIKNSSKLISAILMTLIGVLFIIKKMEIIGIAMTVFGVLLIVQAVLDVLAKDVVSCVIKAVIGIAIIIFGWALVDIATIVLGVALIIYGALRLIDCIKGFKSQKSTVAKIVELIIPVICLFIGVSVFIGTFGSIANVMFIIAGIFLILHGVLDLIDCITAK
jgi:uncharacterized membrane protein HdeD (DUF308 family)